MPSYLILTNGLRHSRGIGTGGIQDSGLRMLFNVLSEPLFSEIDLFRLSLY